MDRLLDRIFDWIFGWYLRGIEMACFIYRVHSGMACLLAPLCDPHETEAFIERCRSRDAFAFWAEKASICAGPLVVYAIVMASWLWGVYLSGTGLAVEMGVLAVWVLWVQPFLLLQVHLWRATSMGYDTAALVRRVQPFRVAQAAEHVQQHLSGVTL
ncbi:MAG TPA: hypothetical protein VGH74_07780 [Planctomycetaceae bacterium]